MNFLKGLAISLLTFLLFLSLAVFGMVFTLNSTILNPDFIVAQVDRLDISLLVREVAEEEISGELPPEVAFLEEALYDVIADNEPWLKEQANAGIYSFYDFLLGESEKLILKINMEPLKENLRDSVWQLFQQNLQSLPPELAAAPPTVIEQYFNEFYQELAEQIPPSFEIDESSIPFEVMDVIIQARQYISYVQTAYYGLIGLMVLLVLAVILLERDVKTATRELGITFLFYGALEYAGIWAINYFAPSLPLPDMPPSIQTWLVQLVDDFMAPLETFSIGLMAVGAALIIVSIVYRRRVVEGD